MNEDRREFLLEMYRQMFNDINRHIMVVWQSVGVVIGAFAIFSLIEKELLPVDVAVSLIVLLCGWLFAHLVDAGYWYNRNLAIIANIERQFLTKDDLHNIHYYFGSHRPNNKMITHLRIQFALGLGIAGLVLLFHFLTRVLPGFTSPISNFEPMRALPYLACAVGLLYLRRVVTGRIEAYSEFLRNSPGISVETDGVEYGTGHGFGKTSGG